MSNINGKRLQQLKNADTLLWRQIKAEAAMEDTTLTELVEPILRKWLAAKKKKAGG